MVCDVQETYLGKLYYTDLVHHPSKILVGDVMVEDADWISADMSEADLAILFEKHNLISAAVVDQNGKLVGRITSADVMPLIHKEAEKPYLQASGLSQDEYLFAPIGPSTRRWSAAGFEAFWNRSGTRGCRGSDHGTDVVGFFSFLGLGTLILL